MAVIGYGDLMSTTFLGQWSDISAVQPLDKSNIEASFSVAEDRTLWLKVADRHGKVGDRTYHTSFKCVRRGFEVVEHWTTDGAGRVTARWRGGVEPSGATDDVPNEPVQPAEPKQDQETGTDRREFLRGTGNVPAQR